MERKTPQSTPSTHLSPEWPWDDSLDALNAAPRHHRRIFENDRVRVLEGRIPRGEMVPVHTHHWPAILHLLSWSDHVRYDESGSLISTHETAGCLRPFLRWSGANRCRLTRWKTLVTPSYAFSVSN